MHTLQMKFKIGLQEQSSSPNLISSVDIGRCQLTQKTNLKQCPDMGLLEFTWMPFGLTGAPSTFQRMVNKIFRGLSFVTTDVMVHSATIEEHVHQVSTTP